VSIRDLNLLFKATSNFLQKIAVFNAAQISTSTSDVQAS